MQNKKNIALIVAAGSGSRSGLDIPKQYNNLNGKTVLNRAIETFTNNNFDVAVVINEDHKDLYDKTITREILPPIFGGKTRQESVLMGLKYIEKYSPDNVFIHDAARPFISNKIIEDLQLSLEKYDGSAPILEITDSISEIDGGIIKASLDRNKIVRMQTPQAFDYKKIFNAHLKTKGNYTDDISLAIANGLNVGYVKGDIKNKKLTMPEDFETNYPDIRTAMGYDVHRLIKGDRVILGGVKIECPFSLKGHSDADVLLHAITDAILGTISNKDIGAHFSDKDPRWKGQSSDKFLKYAIDLLKKQGGTLHYLDATIICEKPKISPHRDKIRDNIAKICDIDISKISIKATTTEGLGFTGREEGISANAIVNCFFH